MHFIGVFNSDGGTFRTMDMPGFVALAETTFVAHGQSLECRVVAGGDLIAELERAAADPASDVLLAGGGDGTISAAAGICFAHKMALAVLPAGTMNLFARSLGLPLQLEAALAANAGGEIGLVDIATANGQPFVHQFSVGLHSRLVRIRNDLTYHSRWGKMLASLRAVTLALSRPLVFDAEISTPQGTDRRKATAIAVSNNVLGTRVPYAEALDRGVLGVYVIKPMRPWALVRLALSMVFGRWKDHPLVSEKEVAQVGLHFPHRKASAQAVIDGELVPLARFTDLRIHAQGLRVMLPVVEKPASEGDPAGATA